MLIAEWSRLQKQEVYNFINPLVITQKSGYKKPLWIKIFITYRLKDCINRVIVKNNWKYNIKYFVEPEDLIGYLIYNYVKAEQKYQANVENKHINVYERYLTTFMEKSIEKYIINFVIRKNTHRKKDSPKIKYIYQCNEIDKNEYYSFRKYHNPNSNRCDFDFDFSNLTELQKKVIELKYYQDLSTQKIAEKMGVTSDYVRQLHFRAIQVLKQHNKHLESYYNRLIRKVA
jgi:RNA polymerase sigma factor (sigma-70 family)